MNKEGELKKQITVFIESLNIPESYSGMNDDFAQLPHERRYELLGLIEEAKKEMGQKLCEYCDMQEWSCNNSKDCPRNIAIEKWFGED